MQGEYVLTWNGNVGVHKVISVFVYVETKVNSDAGCWNTIYYK